MELCFVTHNRHKLQEVQALLPSSITLRNLDDIGWKQEIPETASTIEGNACQKADRVRDKLHIDCFADDTGLEVMALNGAPGVFSARYAGPAKDSGANCAKLLQDLEGESQRKAQFRTVICLWLKGGKYLFEGIVNGEIVPQPRGSNGFGYDPLFQPDGSALTFAEMSDQQKNNISHRGIAVMKMVDFIKGLNIRT